MIKDKRVIQAEEMLKELEEPYKMSDLMGGFTTILLGCAVATIALEVVKENE